MNENTPMTECIDPTQVEDSDISAFASGAGRPEFARHLAKCRFCQQETAEFQAMAALLDANLGRKRAAHRTACLDTEQIAQLVLDLLPSEEKKQVKAHLKDCNYCMGEFNLLKADAQESWLPDFEPAGITFPDLAGVREGLRRVIATLTQPRMQPQFALRSSNRATPDRFQHYQADDVIVTIELVREARYQNEGWRVKGLVSRDDDLAQIDDIEVELTQDDRPIASETLDELGSFTFDKVADPARVGLNIRFVDKLVVVPPRYSFPAS